MSFQKLSNMIQLHQRKLVIFTLSVQEVNKLFQMIYFILGSFLLFPMHCQISLFGHRFQHGAAKLSQALLHTLACMAVWHIISKNYYLTHLSFVSI